MNERIRELIEQAHEQKPVIVLDPVTCEPTHKIGNGGVPMYHSELNPEKFAELIVRECLEKIYSVTIDNPTDDWDQGYNSGLDQAAETIKTHFGVEE